MKTKSLSVAIVLSLIFPVFGMAAAGDIAPSPGELFSVFSASRDSAKPNRVVDPKFFARSRLEKALRFADGLIEDAQVPGFDMTRVGLLDLLSVVGIDAVYSYRISSIASDPVALQMQASFEGQPVLLTIGFRLEEGTWRMNNTEIDRTGSWYQSDLTPVRTWSYLSPPKTPWMEVSGK